MNKELDYITTEKKKALLAELETLKTTKRKEILDSLEFAKSLGDLSENAEYHSAREEQGKLEERIGQIEHILRNAVVMDKKAHGAIIEIGSTVTVSKKGSSEKTTYQIVGSEESDMTKNKISNRSPMGEILFGKKKGDIVSVVTPRGPIEYSVTDVA